MKKFSIVLFSILLVLCASCFGSSGGGSGSDSNTNGTLTVTVSGVEDGCYADFDIYTAGTTAYGPLEDNEADIVIKESAFTDGKGSGISVDDGGKTVTLTGGTHILTGAIWNEDESLTVSLLIVKNITINGDTAISLTQSDFYQEGKLAVTVTGVTDGYWVDLDVFPGGTPGTDFENGTAVHEADVIIEADSFTDGTGTGYAIVDYGDYETLTPGIHIIIGGIWNGDTLVSNIAELHNILIDGDTTITLSATENFTPFSGK